MNNIEHQNMEVKGEKYKHAETTNHLTEPSNAMQETNADDPVVHEIPVFLAQSLAKQLFMFQVYIIFASPK